MTLPPLEENVLLYAVAGAGILVVLVLLASLFSKKKPKAQASAPPPPARAPAPAAPPAEPVRAAAPSAPAPAPVAPAAAAPPAPIPAAPPAESAKVAAAKPELILPFNSAEAWPAYDRRFREGVLVDGQYRLMAGEGVRSAQHLAALPGATYRLDFEAVSIRDSSNGAPNNFAIGPLFLDASGAVLNRWKAYPGIMSAEGKKAGSVEAVAPENTVAVHVGMSGSSTREGAAGDGIVAITSARLSEV